MKTMHKLVALLMAAVMVLGMMPAMTVHAHAHTAAAQGIEEYPSIALDTATAVDITEGGSKAYFTFTPEVTDLYHFYSTSAEGSYTDTYGHLYDADMKELAFNDDCNTTAVPEILNSSNFCISYVLEAGKTYVFAARLYNAYFTGSFTVTLTQGHEYESVVTKEATCSEDGVRTHTCKHCGEVYEETIPAAHIYSDETGECIFCGEAYLLTGTCGENVSWSLDWFGKLVISGTGDMDSYSVSYSANNPAPWYYDHNDAITSVVVEEGVTSVGAYAFYQCRNLTAVTLADSVATLGTAAFNNCNVLTSVKLPASLEAIPDNCFNYCALSEIDWPAGLTSIGKNAFSGCPFGDLTLPEGLTFIGQNAFNGCSNIGRLTLPSTLTTVDASGFRGMWNTTEFVFTGDAPSIGSYSFSYLTATVWYPNGNDTWTEEVRQNYGGTLTWKPMCPESHAYGEPVTVEATCEVGSYMTMTCTACGFCVSSPENDDALGHDFQYNHVEGGCGESSYDQVTCSRCDYNNIENRVWNDHDYVTTQVEATCTEGGYSVDTCSICGDTYQWNWTSALGHSVAEWSDPTEATCTEASVKTGTCERCGEAASEEVSPALGHEWDEENGITNDDGSMTYSCIRCDATYRTEGNYLYLGDNTFTVTAESGRGIKTYTAEKSGTLTITMNQMTYHNAWAWENGWIDTYWSPLAIDYVFDNSWINVYVNNVNTAYTIEGSENDANVIFSTIEVKAGDTIEIEVNHLSGSDYSTNDIQFNMNLALEAAEEPQPGNDTLFLGDNEIDLVSGASFVGSWTAKQDGTLKVQMTKLSIDFYGFWSEEPVSSHLGSKLIFKVNGEAVDTATATAAVAVKTGDVVTVEITNTTMNTYKAIVTLSLEGGEPLPHEHEWSGWTVTTEPTCTEKGEETRSCACGETETREVAALGHDYEAVVTAPTCTEKGYTTYTCSRCGDSYVTDEVAALGHNPAEAVKENETAATCTEAGSYESVVYCSVCDAELSRETVEVAKLGHDYQVKEIVPPTCTKSGYTVYECSRCGKTYKDDPVEPEHKWDEGTVTAPTCTEMGYTTYTCLVCGEKYVDEASWTEALGHDWKGTGCTRCDATRDNPFTDVPEDSFYIDPVLWAVEKDITNGKTETTFDPEGVCMRAHVVTFLWRAMGSPEPTETNNPFTDVDADDFYYKAVLWAVEKGITNGTTATTFDPEGECNRAQVVTFLWRAMGKPEAENAENPFTDVETGKFYTEAVLWAVENNITNGMGDGTFGVEEPCNRAQVVTFLYRTLVGNADK